MHMWGQNQRLWEGYMFTSRFGLRQGKVFEHLVWNGICFAHSAQCNSSEETIFTIVNINSKEVQFTNVGRLEPFSKALTEAVPTTSVRFGLNKSIDFGVRSLKWGREITYFGMKWDRVFQKHAAHYIWRVTLLVACIENELNPGLCSSATHTTYPPDWYSLVFIIEFPSSCEFCDTEVPRKNLCDGNAIRLVIVPIKNVCRYTAHLSGDLILKRIIWRGGPLQEYSVACLFRSCRRVIWV